MTSSDASILIASVLTKLGYCTTPFVVLLVATMAQESAMGQYETQLGGGPGRGIYQCEDPTFQDIYNNFLSYHAALKAAVDSYKPQLTTRFCADWLIHNHEYATAIAACSYIRHHVPPATMDHNDIDGLWNLYKQYYNGYTGAAMKDQFVANYNKYVNQ